MRVITEEQRARHRAKHRAWAAANKDKMREYNRAWKKRNAVHVAEYDKKRHTVRIEQAKRLRHTRREAEARRAKPDSCEICNSIGRVFFDHCHQRGVFRGWICSNCNCALGFVKDDPNHLRKLIAYLERTKNVISPQLTLPV